MTGLVCLIVLGLWLPGHFFIFYNFVLHTNNVRLAGLFALAVLDL